MGSALAKTAMALVLLGWHRGSTAHVAVTAALAWSAVHAHYGSIFVAVSVFVAILVDCATAAYDLRLSAFVWNPTMAFGTGENSHGRWSILGWHRGSTAHVAVTAALAWSAVHAHYGSIFVAVSVFVAILVEPLARRDWNGARRGAAVIAIVVVLLQVPYMAHRLSDRSGDNAMGIVSNSVGQIVSGSARPELGKSVAGYVDAVHFIEIAPWRVPFVGWVLIACAGIVAVRHRRDPSLLAITLLPQAAAVAGYALFLAELDRYYYLSLMPAAILMVVLAATALPPPRFVGLVGVVLLAVAVALAPGRLRLAATMHQMPEYRLLVDASRRIKNVGQSIQAIRTDFALPRTADPEFLYQVLGGRIDPASPWIALITADGAISYQNVDDSTAGL